jgi:hypothetical protein
LQHRPTTAVNATMPTYAYNTRISLIKAGRIITTKITISLTLIWTALAIAAAFLLLNNAGFSMLSEEGGGYNNIHALSPAQTAKQTNDGAFVFVVRNSKVILTTYTAYVDNNQPAVDVSKPTIAAALARKNTTAVVRQIKNIKRTSKPDFSVKRVPNQ